MKFDRDKEPKFDQMVSAFDWTVPPIFDEYVDNEEVNLKNVNLDTFQDKTIEFVSLKNSTSLCQERVCKSDSTRDILASTCALDVESCVDQTRSNILMVSGNRDVVLEFKNGCTPQHIATHEQPKAVEVTPTFEFHDSVWYDFMHTNVTKKMRERKELLQYLEVDISSRNLYKLLRLMEITAIFFYYAKKLFVSLKKKTKHAKKSWLQDFGLWIDFESVNSWVSSFSPEESDAAHEREIH